MIKAIFPGSFDPVTNGHLNIIQRASRMFDEIDVVIAQNPNKKYMFSSDERYALIKDLVKDIPNVSVHVWNGIIVDYAHKSGAKVLIRGIRNQADFSFEFELALMNHNLASDVETLFIPTDQKYLLLKSSMIKELAKLNGNISGMVPSVVENALKKKLCL